MRATAAARTSTQARVLAALAATTMTLTLLPTQAHAAPGDRFSDVPAGHQFRDEIEWLADMGVTTGWADGTFRPGESVTREAFAAFLHRLTGSAHVALPSRSPFSDVAPSAQFYREIVWLAQEGISTGWADGTFRPRDPISREAVAAFLYRLAGSPELHFGQGTLFRDHADITFGDEVKWLSSTGITTGYSDLTFRPLDNVSREAVAAFLYRGSSGLRSRSAGSHDVRHDIFPGTYVADIGSTEPPLCRWTVRTDPGVVTLPASRPARPPVIEILDTDLSVYFETCLTWRPLRPTSPNATSFADGTFVAGHHMRPGIYLAPGGASCDWVAWEGFRPDDESYDAADGTDLSQAVWVGDGMAVTAMGCGTWQRVGG